VRDLLTLVGHHERGGGIFVTLPQARDISLGSRQRHELERLSFELLAATRLREYRRTTWFARLSASEELVMRLLVAGASDKTIADELGVGLSTVSTFARRARSKLGCAAGGEALALYSPSPRRPRRWLELFERLTPAECDVASALLVGSSSSDIAERRSVSARTVAAQCATIFRKCGVSGRRELAATLLDGCQENDDGERPAVVRTSPA
jgi:DNA-binding NarL/FixJ family response regulator